jgi:hypothetical protein
MRGRWKDEPAQITYLSRLGRYLRGTEVPYLPDVTRPPSRSLLRPSLWTLEHFDECLRRDGWNCLSIDIENAGQFITLVGLTAMDLPRERIGPSLSLPFRIQGGRDYWPTWKEHEEAVGFLYRWLANPQWAKLFHNGVTHDVPMLEETGFVVEGELWDTMTMIHYCYPEMRKGLAFNATLYCGTPHWKTLVDEKDEAEGKG